MDNSAHKALMGSRHFAADWLRPEALKAPGMVALAAAGHVALILNAQPETLPAIGEIARLDPLLAIACVAVGALVCVQVSRLSDDKILSVRRVTTGLIAACLALILVDALGFINAEHQPWAFIIAATTGLVLLGGLTTLIADARAFFAR